MTTREKNVMEVVAAINQYGYDNGDVSVITCESEAELMYGASGIFRILPPHIAIWIKPEDRNIWANTGLWDDAITREDGQEIAIYFFTDEV